jgi:hypothetical protein
VTDQPAGPLLDALAVTLDIEDGDQLTEVLVLGKVTNFESGDTGLVIGTSEGLDWIAQHGLIRVGELVIGRAHVGDE